jgi:hypothetical protein
VTAILALVWLTACTTTSTSTSPAPVPASPNPQVIPEPEGPQALVDPASLTSCDPTEPNRRQTVAFVISGAAWAVDPKSGTLSCLFEASTPSRFLWGPLGDRVAMNDGEVLDAEGHPLGEALGLNDPVSWSRPTGKSLVYLLAGATTPTKYTVASDALTDLRDLPAGTYEALTYHPSGVAMAVSVVADGEPQIFLATNEGARSERVVVGVSALSFPQIGFDDAGEHLYYAAEHKGGYVQLHRLTLQPNVLMDGWRSESPLAHVSAMFVGPGSISPIALTARGKACSTSVAMMGDTEIQDIAIPELDGPTHALGFLDDRRLLVGAGGCGEPLDLYVVGRGPDRLIVEGVRTGASRAAGSPEPAAPIDPGLLADIQEFG